METTTIAVDLAKNVFEIAVSKEPGIVDERKRLSRSRFLSFFAERKPAIGSTAAKAIPNSGRRKKNPSRPRYL